MILYHFVSCKVIEDNKLNTVKAYWTLVIIFGVYIPVLCNTRGTESVWSHPTVFRNTE